MYGWLCLGWRTSLHETKMGRDKGLRFRGYLLGRSNMVGMGKVGGQGEGQALYDSLSAAYVVIRNRDARTCDNPATVGIDLAHAMQCRIENAFINTGSYNVQASRPTYDAKGRASPLHDNAVLTILRNVETG
jgi:hypothetical protein